MNNLTIISFPHSYKTLDGIFLYGTNSFLASEGKDEIGVKSGDIKIFKFSFPLDLNSGDYMLSFGVSAGNPQSEMIPLDRRYDSVILHVRKKWSSGELLI